MVNQDKYYVFTEDGGCIEGFDTIEEVFEVMKEDNWTPEDCVIVKGKEVKIKVELTIEENK